MTVVDAFGKRFCPVDHPRSQSKTYVNEDCPFCPGVEVGPIPEDDYEPRTCPCCGTRIQRNYPPPTEEVEWGTQPQATFTLFAGPTLIREPAKERM